MKRNIAVEYLRINYDRRSQLVGHEFSAKNSLQYMATDANREKFAELTPPGQG